RAAISDSLWASAFAANIRFARDGSDYFARTQPPSPFQHFWTLAVEEQFYLVWPALFALMVFGTLAVAGSHRPPVLLLLSAIAGVSLAWSIHATSANPASAYFSTFARAWELALGAALALAAPAVARRLPSSARFVLGWIGCAAIAVAALGFSST